MKIKESVEEYLREQPLFRERKNKDRGIVNLLGRRYGALGLLLKRGELTVDTVVAIIQDAYSMDRRWRQALQHDPTLRGSDYDDKEVLEQEAEIELGYVPGHDADVKKLKTL